MTGFIPTYERFRELARTGRRLPVYCRLLSDHLTPVSAFARLARRTRHAFLLESVVGGEKAARYSFVGADPGHLYQAFGKTIRITEGRRNAKTFHDTDPLRPLEKLLHGVKTAPLTGASSGIESLPRFTGGAVGYAAYDLVRHNERLPQPPPDDRGLPELEFGIYDTMTIFDHVNKTILVVSHALPDQRNPRAAYREACRKIEAVLADLSRPAREVTALLHPTVPAPTLTSNLTQDEFRRAVERSVDYIRAGDIFQVVLSQRLRTVTRADPFDIYRALRVINPSPFMFYLKGSACTLIGASPEILCRVEDGVVHTRPLAGTRPRGRSEQEDRALESELLADPKDRAEHIMLVDLGRNDIGRVSVPGSVTLSDVMTVERYSHVMHLCSHVQGRLAPGRTAFDALRVSLPVGTVSGAPKVRAMEIIDEFEPTRRGPYGGAVGYFDYNGNMDTCIALRTMVVTKKASRRRTKTHCVDIQVGAGIVADSDPDAEYTETINKAGAMLSAVAVAERGLQHTRRRRR
jgi:anthranilate synthase component 1